MTSTRQLGRLSGIAAAALAGWLLAGCAPEFNWREVHGPDGDYRVMLPGKPVSMTRNIRLEELPVPMTMQGARVDEISFTVAVAKLPDAQATTQEKALAAMRAGMLRNIAATGDQVKPIAATLIDAAGVTRGRAPALQVDAQGSVNGRPVTMSAGFAALGGRAYQWVVIGPQVPAEQTRTFIESFRLLPTSTPDAGSSGASSQAASPPAPPPAAPREVETDSAKGPSK